MKINLHTSVLVLMLGLMSCDNAPKTAPVAAPTAAPVVAPQQALPDFQTAGIDDTKAFQAFFEQFKGELLEPARKKELAMLIAYPIKGAKDEKEFLSNYDKLITPEVRTALKNQAFDKLFVNAKGVMVGNGQMWFGTTKEKGFAVIGINPTTQAPVSQTSALLQGKWQSVEDPQTEFLIAGSTFSQYYKGKEMDKGSYTFSADCSAVACKESEVKNANGCFIFKGKSTTDCHAINAISETHLEWVGGAGAAHIYKKVK